MTDDLRYIKNVSRINYFNYPAINPFALFEGATLDTIDSFAHEELSADCQQLHAAGDTEVIFEYAKKDVWAFRSRWVVDQIEQWRLENTPESRDKLHRLMRAYTDERGHDPLPEIIRLIERDQGIYKEIIILNHQQKIPLRGSRDKDGCFDILAEKHGLSVGTIEEIYQVYQAKASERMGKRPVPLLDSHFLPKRHYKVLSDAFKTMGWDTLVRSPQRVFSSYEEVFRWLDEMLSRLRALCGGEKAPF